MFEFALAAGAMVDGRFAFMLFALAVVVVVVVFVAPVLALTEVLVVVLITVFALALRFPFALPLLAAVSPQAIPIAPRPRTAESAITFFISRFSCLLQRLLLTCRRTEHACMTHLSRSSSFIFWNYPKLYASAMGVSTENMRF